MPTNYTSNYNLGKPQTGDSNWGPILNQNAEAIDGAMHALDQRVGTLEDAPVGGVIRVDQEVVTFDANGEYVLASAPGGVVAGTVPMLTFDGVVQDGVTSAKRFEVVDQNDVAKKLKLLASIDEENFSSRNRPRILAAGGVKKINAMVSNTEQAAGDNAQTVTASSEETGAGRLAWRAVDGESVASTFWEATAAATPQAPQWWQINFASPVSFDDLEIGVESYQSGWKNFEIRASNDNMATYDVLYTGVDEVWSEATCDINANISSIGANFRRVFANPNRLNSYTSIRLHVTSSPVKTHLSHFQLNSGGQRGLAVNNLPKRHLYVQDSRFALGTSDFTFEAWIFPRHLDWYNVIFDLTNGTDHFIFGMANADGIYIYASNIGWVANHGPWRPELQMNTWNHVAWVRDGSAIRVYVNGVPTAVGTLSYSIPHTYLGIGDTPLSGNDDSFTGMIRNARITTVARYFGGFTPFPVGADIETYPDPYADKVILRATLDSYADASLAKASGALPILNTADTMGLTVDTGTRADSLSANLSLAIPMNGVHNGTAFSDVSHLARGTGAALALTRNGALATSIATSRFYGSSGNFGDLGAYSPNCLVVNDASLALGTGDFTIEMWVNPIRLYNYMALATTRPNNGGYGDAWHIYINGAGQLGLFSDASDLVSSEGVISSGVWQHVALTRSGNTVRLFKDGVQVAINTNYNRNLTRYLIGIGQFPTQESEGFSGYLQDFRLYKGVAKYTANFKAPATGTFYFQKGPVLLPPTTTKCLVSYQAQP